MKNILINFKLKVKLRKKQIEKYNLFSLNSAHADGGPRSRVCTRLTLDSAPHQLEQMSAKSPSNISSNPTDVLSTVSEP